MTIEQCARGHKIICILNNLGISFDENENDKDDQNYDDFFSFKDIYLNCKNFKIAPFSVVFPWIKDLFLCYSILNDNCYSSLSINSEFKGYNAIYNNVDYSITSFDQLNTNRVADNNENGDLDFEKENNNLNENNIHLKSKEQEQSVIQVPHEGLYNQSIPFVSQISGVIYTKKKECTRLQNEKINLESKLKELHKKIKTANDHLANISKKEGVIQYYLDWFYRLKKELWDVYCIRIEDISNFVNVISEFEHHHYDAYQIISEYSRFLSVRHEIIIKETQIATLEQKKRSLYGKIVSLESRLSFVNRRMEIYEELEAIGFGIKELGQLYSLFVEMSDANNIPLKQAWSKFFKDIKEQYDCKLGFELDIEEYKEKLEKNKNEFPNSVYDLQIKSFVSPVIFRLLQAGITEVDIINMNALVTELVNNNFFLTESSPEVNIDKEQQHKVNDRILYWNTLKNKLRFGKH